MTVRNFQTKGHGGSNAANFAGKNVHRNIVETAEFQQKNYHAAMKAGFLKTDVDLRQGAYFPNPYYPSNFHAQ